MNETHWFPVFPWLPFSADAQRTGGLGLICVTFSQKKEVRTADCRQESETQHSKMTDETASSLPQEHQVDAEGTGSDAELERGGKQAKFDDEDSDNDSTVSSSNSNSTQASFGKRGFRGKGRKKKSLAFRCVNFLKVTCFMSELQLILV